MLPSEKQISNSTHSKYFEDGIWDIVIGAIFLLVGVAVWYDMNAISLAPLIFNNFPSFIKAPGDSAAYRAYSITKKAKNNRGVAYLWKCRVGGNWHSGYSAC